MTVPELTLVATGRRLAFGSNPGIRAHLFRRVGGDGGPWQRVAVNASFPFFDEDVLAHGTLVEYCVHVQANASGGTAQDRSFLLSALI